MENNLIYKEIILNTFENKYIYDYFHNYQNRLQLLYNIKQYLSGMLPDEKINIISVFKNCMEELINEVVPKEIIFEIFPTLKENRDTETVSLETCLKKITEICNLIFNKYGYFIEFNTIDMNSVKVELSFQSKEIVKILKAAKKLLYKNIFLNLCTRSFTHPYYLCMVIRKSLGEYIYKRKQQKSYIYSKIWI